MSKRSRELLVVALAVTCLVACESREVGSSSTATRGQESGPGKLVFSDDFERTELGDDWRRGSGEGGSGTWRIEDGWLAAHDIKNDPLWLDRKLPHDVRVEFDAKALSPEGDLKVEIFGDGEVHASGYILIFGGWSNSLDVIARLDEHGDDRKAKKTQGVLQNRTYRIAVERTDGTLKWFVDGKPFMEYDDPEPLRGEGHAYFAFNDWTAPVRFDDVKVYEIQ